MSGTSSVHPEQINAISGRFSDVGQELAEVIRRDGGRLDDVGEVWGDDETGEQFARVYVPAAQLAIQALVRLAISIPQIGVGLRQMGQSSSRNESNIVAQLGASSSAARTEPGLAIDDGGRLLTVSVPTPSATELAMNPSRHGQIGDAAGGSVGGTR